MPNLNCFTRPEILQQIGSCRLAKLLACKGQLPHGITADVV